MTLEELTKIAQHLNDRIADEFPSHISYARQIIAMAEESGEFVGAARRYIGMARRSGTFEEMASELADVVIVAMCTADVFDVDIEEAVKSKLDKILNRPIRDNQ